MVAAFKMMRCLSSSNSRSLACCARSEMTVASVAVKSALRALVTALILRLNPSTAPKTSAALGVAVRALELLLWRVISELLRSRP
jgi:hypothetical protein